VLLARNHTYSEAKQKFYVRPNAHFFLTQIFFSTEEILSILSILSILAMPPRPHRDERYADMPRIDRMDGLSRTNTNPSDVYRARMISVFSAAVRRWADRMPPGENKIAITTLFVLYRRGDICPTQFYNCIGQCAGYIASNYICTVVITGYVPYRNTGVLRTRFVIRVHRDSEGSESEEDDSENSMVSPMRVCE
jgi:hypothetical protein